MQMDAQMDAAELQAKVTIEQQKQQAEDARTAAELQARMSMNSQDNQTAMALAQAEIQSGERFAVSTGTGINPQP
jgi:thioredoxin-like negative regulator of GroEL